MHKTDGSAARFVFYERNMHMLSKYIAWGTVLKPQGIKGQVKIGVELLDEEWISDLEEVYLLENGEYRPIAIQNPSVRYHENAVYAYLNHCTNRNDAELQRGWQLYVDRNDVEMPENQDLIDDLIGCSAITRSGEKIGTLKEVFHLPANDVYVFDTPKGEMMLPALLKVMPEIDTENQIIYIDEKVLPEVAVYQESGKSS